MPKELASHYKKKKKLFSLYFLTPYIKKEFQVDETFTYKYENIDMLRGDMGKCIYKLRVGNVFLNISKI